MDETMTVVALLATSEDENWRDKAECNGADPEIFFPDLEFDTAEARRAKTKAAREYCRACPVRQECLDWALDNRVTDGIYGGQTYGQRKAYRKQMEVTA